MWIDVSAYGGSIPIYKLQTAKDLGVRGVCVQAYGGSPDGVKPNPYCKDTLRDSLAVGLVVAAYVWPPNQWQVGLNNCDPYIADLNFYALDVESGAAVSRAHVDGVKAYARPVIYTSMSQWQNIMWSSDFADVALWDARYDGVPDLGNFQAYGGWTSRMGKQYAGTSDVAGISCDLNVFSDEWIGGVMSQEELDKIWRKIADMDTHIGKVEGSASNLWSKAASQDAIIGILQATVKNIQVATGLSKAEVIALIAGSKVVPQ